MTGTAANRSSIKQTEHTYATMMHWSDSLGVNCTYCHNTQAFAAWGANATPQRATAWYGIRMAREINNEYMVPITNVFPSNRLGPTGDVAKTNCATCHQGAYKPLYGAAMAKHYPGMQLAVKADPAAVPVTPATPEMPAMPGMPQPQGADPAVVPAKPEIKAQIKPDIKPVALVSATKPEVLVK